MVYWLVSLPLISNRVDRTWEVLQEKTSAAGHLSNNYRIDIPDLRVGTLDSLMTLSDDLVKVNNSFEGIVGKITRTITDLNGPGALSGLKVGNLPPEAYLTRFKWEEPKFPSRRPLKETVDKVTEIMSHIEDDLKVKMSDYNSLKSQLSAIARKTTGSLAVRDISALVKPRDFVDSENLTTLYVIVGKYSLKDWLSSYEKLSNYVVPRSSKVISEDNDYILASVVLFKRVIDEFKVQARAKGFTVREYTPGSEAETSGSAAEQLKKDLEVKKASLEQWCKTAFGESLSCWLHTGLLRLFVESILRYGLPPQFLVAVVKPAEKQEPRLRTVLANTFGTDASYWKDDGSSSVAGLATDTDLHPYVSFTVNLDWK